MGNNWFNLRAAELWFYLSVIRPWRLWRRDLWWRMMPTVSVTLPFGDLRWDQSPSEHIKPWLDENIGREGWSWDWTWLARDERPWEQTLKIWTLRWHRDKLAEFRIFFPEA